MRPRARNILSAVLLGEALLLLLAASRAFHKGSDYYSYFTPSLRSEFAKLAKASEGSRLSRVGPTQPEPIEITRRREAAAAAQSVPDTLVLWLRISKTDLMGTTWARSPDPQFELTEPILSKYMDGLPDQWINEFVRVQSVADCESLRAALLQDCERVDQLRTADWHRVSNYLAIWSGCLAVLAVLAFGPRRILSFVNKCYRAAIVRVLRIASKSSTRVREHAKSLVDEAKAEK